MILMNSLLSLLVTRISLCALALTLSLMPRVVAAAPGTDVDADGLDDNWELSSFGNLSASGDEDPDGDGLDNATEQAAATNPLVVDSDDDGLDDGMEYNQIIPYLLSDPARADSDGDLLSDGDEVLLHGTSPAMTDSDHDGLSDYAEVAIHGSNPTSIDSDGGFADDGKEVLADGTDPLDPFDDLQDSDGDGLTDYLEVAVYGTDRLKIGSDADGYPDGDEVAAETLPMDPDSDDDGLLDGTEVFFYGTDPLDEDSDDDGLLDGAETSTHLTDPTLPDSDYDTLEDGYEVSAGLDPLSEDSDGGGLLDPVEVWQDLDPTTPGDDLGLDLDGDGLSQRYEDEISFTDPAIADSDGDGLDDGEEIFPLADHFLSNALDADSDDDGLIDGNEGGVLTPSGSVSLGTSPIDADTDSDDLTDGVERGLTAPQISALDPDATDPASFVADEDPLYNSDPRSSDTDKDGLKDGEEDRNHNGRWDSALGDPYWPDGETNVASSDSDGDGMGDAWEVAYADPDEGVGPPLNPLDPNDGDDDPDLDGLSNLSEYTLVTMSLTGTITQNRTNPRDPDSDDDGLNDGVEANSSYAGLGLGSNPNIPDSDGDGILDSVEDGNGDGKTGPGEMNPMRADTDGDGLGDGDEDLDGDGETDPGETDALLWDTDGDDLSDGEEIHSYGSNPLLTDSDDDGLPDGLEVGKGGDADPLTKTNPTKLDSDGDGLSDGDEDQNLNGAQDQDETDATRKDSDGDGLGDGLELGVFGDADPSTTTNPLVSDSDGDALLDGIEDRDRDGAVGSAETDPNEPDTDGGGVPDGVEVLADTTNPLDGGDDGTSDPDGDGLNNYLELDYGTDRYLADSDADGIRDDVEVGLEGAPVDSDEDGLIDALDDDSDDDGIPDSWEAGDDDLETPPVDSDEDELPDYLDLDSDEDGISDAVEWAVDADLDAEADPDADGDGVDNYLDEDSDNDGKLDADEGEGDLDGDWIPNFVDPEDDTPGPEDAVESTEGSSESVEIVDAVEVTPAEASEIIESEATETTLDTVPEIADDAVDDSTPSPDQSCEGPSFGGRIQGGVMCAYGGPGHGTRTSGIAGLLLLLTCALLALWRRQRRGPSGRGIVLALLLLSPSLAQASEPPDALAPAHHSLRGGAEALGTTETGAAKHFLGYEAGLVLGYSSASLVEITPDSGNREWLGYRLGGEVHGAIGLSPFNELFLAELGVGLPFILYQDARAQAGETSMAVAGVSSLVLVPAVQALKEARHGVTLGLQSSIHIPLGARASYFHSGFEATTRLAASRSLGPILLAGNVYLRNLASDIDVGDVRQDDQLGVALAASAPIDVIALEVYAETYLSVPVKRPFENKEETFAEAAAGLSRSFGPLRATLHAATGLSEGFGVPRVRAMLGLSYIGGTAAPSARATTVAPSKSVAAPVVATTDTDGDGIGADADACPAEPEDLDGYQDEDGCRDQDNDEDGVPDAQDKCPDTAEDIDGFEDNDGCPDRDNDGDGILDGKDQCPLKPETLDGVADDDGCPEESTPSVKDVSPSGPPRMRSEEVLPEKVLFANNSAKVQSSYRGLIERLARQIAGDASLRLVVSGHASLTGNPKTNKRLSKKRAENVRSALIKAGAPAKRVELRSLSTSHPLVKGINEGANSVNRRVEFSLQRWH